MLIHPNTAKNIIDFITDFTIAQKTFLYDALGDCTHELTESKILTLASLTKKPYEEVYEFCKHTLETVDSMQFCQMLVSTDIEIASDCEEPLYYNEDWEDFEEEEDDDDFYTFADLKAVEDREMNHIIRESLGL